MERQLFDWANWDVIDEGSYQFYDCVFKVDFGPFKAGQKCDEIVVDYQNGFMQYFDKDGGVITEVKLKLAIL